MPYLVIRSIEAMSDGSGSVKLDVTGVDDNGNVIPDAHEDVLIPAEMLNAIVEKDFSMTSLNNLLQQFISNRLSIEAMKSKVQANMLAKEAASKLVSAVASQEESAKEENLVIDAKIATE